MDYRLTWMSLLGLILLLIAPSVFSHSMNAARKQQVFNLCYGRQRPNNQITPLINGQSNPPLASSVENLIALIEKIENATSRTTYQAKDLAATLLRKFRSDGNVVKSNSFLDQDEVYANMDRIEDALLEPTSDVNFDETTILTENERCSLYYMLSYNINQTEKASSTSSRYNTAFRAPTVNSRPTVGTPRYGNSVNYAPVSLTVRPREYGVGSFRGYTKNAIALNRLLLGVIAGQLNSPGVTVRDVFTKVKSDATLEAVSANIDDIINPLFAVTLSNTMATAAIRDARTAVHGVSGFWDSAACSMDYTLNNENPSEATMANIRGGIDGYYIGELAKNLYKTPSGMKLKLSQILRYYYDNVGGRISGTCYCDKNNVQPDYRTIKDTAINYYKVYEIVKGNPVTETTATYAIDNVETKIRAVIDEAKSIPNEDGEYCASGTTGGGLNDQYNCETPTDLFVAIDLQSQDADKYKNLTTRLINNLNLGIYGSSATVLSLNREDTFTDEKQQTFIKNLRHLAWASYNKGCPGCSMTYPKDEAYNAIAAPSAELYDRINSTLRDFEANKWHLPAAPSRPFIIMGGSYSRNIDQNIRNARYNLKASHRDVQIFLLTNGDQNDLTEYINAPEDLIKEPDGSDTMVKELSEKICKVPAVFQYSNCQRVSAEGNNAFEGYITPGKKQYWAMYPEYFLKSYDITMKFSSTQGNLEVCFGRYPDPEKTGRCYGSDEESRKNGEVRLYVSNPCQDRDLMTCEPFYFTISMSDQGMTATNMCLDKKCLNAKQAKFKFTHAGIQCSSAFSLVSSLYLAIILALLSSFYNQSKQF